MTVKCGVSPYSETSLIELQGKTQAQRAAAIFPFPQPVAIADKQYAIVHVPACPMCTTAITETL